MSPDVVSYIDNNDPDKSWAVRTNMSQEQFKALGEMVTKHFSDNAQMESITAWLDLMHEKGIEYSDIRLSLEEWTKEGIERLLERLKDSGCKIYIRGALPDGIPILDNMAYL